MVLVKMREYFKGADLVAEGFASRHFLALLANEYLLLGTNDERERENGRILFNYDESLRGVYAMRRRMEQLDRQRKLYPPNYAAERPGPVERIVHESVILHEHDRRTIEQVIDRLPGIRSLFPSYDSKERIREGDLYFSVRRNNMLIARNKRGAVFDDPKIPLIKEAFELHSARRNLYSPVDDFNELVSLL
jgi:hypothetical protein